MEMGKENDLGEITAPGDWAAKLTTIVTLLIISSYGIGYLILTVSDGAHGFLEFSLLKPRAIITGAAFIFLTALPISAARLALQKHSVDETKREKAARWSVSCAIYCMMCTFVVLSSSLFFSGGPMAPIRWFNSRAFMVLLLFAMGSSMLLPGARKNYRTYPTACIVIGIICLAGFVVAIYLSWGSTMIRSMLWMGALFFLTIEFVKDQKGFTDTARRYPLGVVALILGAIAIYSTELFPVMNAAWGGGSAQNATAYFSKDSPIDPDKRMNVALLEVSDSGFYLTLEGNNEIIYIPKLFVTAMEFRNGRKQEK